MRVVGGLLRRGNSHLGEAIHTWSLPAVETCPGRTPKCERHCYGRRGFFRMPDVRSGLTRRLQESRRKSFVKKMIREIRRKGVLVLRVHVVGDFYSAGYARKWLAIVRACPEVTFLYYTRSWRIPAIREVLAELAREENVESWFSTDADMEESMPMIPRVRVAFLQTAEGEADARADLAFRVQNLRGTPRVGLPVVCPKNATAGKPEVNCGTCQKCWT